MSSVEIRKIVTISEEVYTEMTKAVNRPVRRSAAAAVIKNPYAGVYQENLELLAEFGAELGALLGHHAVRALKADPKQIESYGKAAIVGSEGELEHAAAILHPKLGKPLRDEVDTGLALVPSSKKMGDVGTPIDVPVGHKNAAYVRTHFDSMEVRTADAPRANEILVVIVVGIGGRPLPRVGGLDQSDIKEWDGLR